MLKVIKLNFLVILLLLCVNNIFAYEYVNPSNKKKVLDKFNEVYDSKNQYEDLVGSYIEEEIELIGATSTTYWWPIGSKETTEVNGKIFATGDPETVYITSLFGYREDPFNRGRLFHTGTDISGGSGLANVNIIAAKDGVVVYPANNSPTNCPSGFTMSSCGGGYGNYVVIQHTDGNYTLYAHMYENSISVKAGDSVKQGQVIGKMGSSGNSTGAHLHFEVRAGANFQDNVVDPLNYVSTENPRTLITGGEFLSWLGSWEGHTPIEGDYYIVSNIGDGVRTVGVGVTLENNIDRFAAHGININDYPTGSKMPISIVEQIKMEEIDEKRSWIEATLSDNSIIMNEHQIEALVSRTYNTGNIVGLVDSYKKYGDTDAFYTNWFFQKLSIGTKFEKGLRKRRNAEWSLFHNGEYVYN